MNVFCPFVARRASYVICNNQHKSPKLFVDKVDKSLSYQESAPRASKLSPSAPHRVACHRSAARSCSHHSLCLRVLVQGWCKSVCALASRPRRRSPLRPRSRTLSTDPRLTSHRLLGLRLDLKKRTLNKWIETKLSMNWP